MEKMEIKKACWKGQRRRIRKFTDRWDRKENFTVIKFIFAVSVCIISMYWILTFYLIMEIWHPGNTEKLHCMWRFHQLCLKSRFKAIEIVQSFRSLLYMWPSQIQILSTHMATQALPGVAPEATRMDSL